MRFELGKQRILFVFEHHLTHQFQANGKTRCGFGGKAFALGHGFHNVQDIVVIGRTKLQRRLVDGMAIGIGGVFYGDAKLVLFHVFILFFRQPVLGAA